MPRRNMHHGRIGLVPGIILSAFVCGVSPLAGQDELQLQRDYPGSAPFVCPAPGQSVEPSPRELAQAGQLASEADNAVILGDYARAEELLAQASLLDPTSADVAYSHARALETLEQPEESMLEYCRAIALGTDEVIVLDARDRLDALDEALRARVSLTARQRFQDGLDQADAGLNEAAAASFTEALVELPDWPEALYNRGIVLERLDLIQESLADYRRYVEITPDVQVAQRIGMLEGLEAIPTPSPGNTLALGILFPGMGQYYTGRNTAGTMVLGTALGALAVGFTYQKVTVRCLDPSAAGGECPPNLIVDESSERPFLGPSLIIAATVTVGAAVEAWIRARRLRAEQEAQASPPDQGFDVSGPSVRTNGDRVDVSIVGVRFR